MRRKTRSRLQNTINDAFEKKDEKFPSSATIVAIDGQFATLQLRNSPSVLSHCSIVGDANSLVVGEEVTIKWDTRQGGYPRPVVIASEGGGTATVVNYTYQGGSFHEHPEYLKAHGWQTSLDGTLFNLHTSLTKDGTITLGVAPDYVKLSSIHSTYRMWAGAVDPASAPFSISKTGAISATDAYIEGTAQSADFSSGVSGWQIKSDGDAEFNNVHVRGTLSAAVFEIEQISATAGTLGVFYSAGAAYEAFTPVAYSTQYDVKVWNAYPSTALFSNGDILRVKMIIGSTVYDTHMRVNGTPTVSADYTTYSCYTVSGSVGTQYPEGSSIIDYGASGTGWISLSADGAIGAAPNITIAEMTHNAGSPPTLTQTVLARMGDLDGSYGKSGETLGFAFGKYASGKPHLRWTDADGLRMYDYQTMLFHLDTNGDVYMGDSVNNNKSHIKITNGNFYLINRDGVGATTTLFQLQSGGDIVMGSNASSNANIFWDESAGRLNFRTGTNSPDIYIDASGYLAIEHQSTENYRIRFMDGSTEVGGITAYGSGRIDFRAYSDTANEPLMVLKAVKSGQQSGLVYIYRDQFRYDAGGATQFSVAVGAAAFTGTLNIDDGLYVGDTVTSPPSNGIQATGVLRVGDGSAGAPSLSFGSDSNTGIYRVGTDELGISTGGLLRFTFNAYGPSSWLAFTQYEDYHWPITASDIDTSEHTMFAAAIPQGTAYVLRKWYQGWYRSGTHDASNRYTIRLKKINGTTTTTIATLYSNSGSSAVWQVYTATPDNSIGSTEDILVVTMQKSGTPGTVALTAPQVYLY